MSSSGGSSTFPSPPVILPELDCSMPNELLRETAYVEQLGIDRSLYPIYRAIEQIYRRLEERAEKISHSDQIRKLGGELVAIESKYKKDGVWGGDLQKGIIPKGQAVVNDLLEKTHELEAELIERAPDHIDKEPKYSLSREEKPKTEM